jgi:hypothetical protein
LYDAVDEGDEVVAGESTSDDESIERVEDIERRRKNHDEGLPLLSCSPVTVVYGHAGEYSVAECVQ